MNCEEARRHWSLYYDSEGDAELYFRINEHLTGCPACAEWFHKESRVEDVIAERLRAVEPTRELWDSVLSQSEIKKPRSIRQWLFMGGSLLLAACLVIAVGLRLSVNNNDDRSRLFTATAAQHRQLSDGTLPVAFTSRSDLEVEAYLRQQVNFPVRCPPRKDTGFAVTGAGVSRLEGEAAAYVFGHVDGDPVSVFILSRDSLHRMSGALEVVRRQGVFRHRAGRDGMVIAEIDRNVVFVVGRADTERLLRVLKAYGTYPHVREG